MTNNLNIRIDKLVSYINGLDDFNIENPSYPYNHMGATITDAILQAGLTWETTVKPRRDRVWEYKEAIKTTGFFNLTKRIGIKKLINWDDDEKPNRILGLTEFFINEEIETEYDLRNWLNIAGNPNTLLSLRGVGFKTRDYIIMLAGTPSIAVDRHIRGFLIDAGLNYIDYTETQNVTKGAAKQLSIPDNVMDHSIWKYKSTS